MKLLGLLFFRLLTVLPNCIGITPQPVDVSVEAVNESIPVPEKTTICEIRKDPAAFNHKLVEVTGFVSRGFEDSGLFDPTCSSGPPYIWVEIGGKGGTGVMYCCNVPAERSRPEELVVEKVPIPLVNDEKFRQFDDLLQENGNSIVRATLIGRYFSGEKETLPNGEYWMGYGHMGIGSLFVVQQVVSVGLQSRVGFDTASSVDQPVSDAERCGTYSFLFFPDRKKDIELQKRIDAGELAWRVTNPTRVAEEGLLGVLESKPSKPVKLIETKRANGRIVYHWRPNGKREISYMVVVSKPYWLSFYAEEPAKTGWVMSAAYSICG